MCSLRNKLLFCGTAAVVGLCSMGIHRFMMENDIDEKGLLIPGNLPGILLCCLGIGLTILVGVLVRRLGGEGSYADNFPRDGFSGGLMLAAGVLMALSVPGLEQAAESAARPGMLGSLAGLAGAVLPWLAAAAMAVQGLFRIRGRRPAAGFAGVLCLFYMVMLVRDYRLWSADPKVYTYAYQLLAGVLLMLCAFHRTCCDAGVIQRGKLITTGLLAAACCLASLSMPFQQNFYLASALWGFGCICDPGVLPPDPEPEPEQDPEQPENA